MENIPHPFKTSLPHQPGTYALIFYTATSQTIPIGRLGLLPVQPGWWIYVGSAFGPGGIHGRVGRHLSPGPVRHWHIDYLKPGCVIKDVWYTTHPAKREHVWASIFLALPGAQIPLRHFGATDCNCPTHLIYFATQPDTAACMEAIQTRSASS